MIYLHNIFLRKKCIAQRYLIFSAIFASLLFNEQIMKTFVCDVTIRNVLNTMFIFSPRIAFSKLTTKCYYIIFIKASKMWL